MHPLALETREGRPFLLRSDRRTSALSERISERVHNPEAGRFSAAEIIQTARDVLHALEPLHQQRLFHGNLRPETVWYLSDGEAKNRICGLVGFGAAAGDPRYLAPERTERVARPADYRCDYYGLGLLIFEMATGHPPFAAGDAAGTLHAHLTETPSPLDQFRADLPAMLIAITQRLLAKHPEERYETSYGILRDLDACEAPIANDAPAVVAGRYDREAVFRIPEGVFGRETEFEGLRKIVSQFARTSLSKANAADAENRGDALLVSRSRLVLITGEAGSGKSAFINALRNLIQTEHPEIRTAGGRQTHSRRTPYEALNQILRELVRGILHLNLAEFSRWRERLAVLPGDGLTLLAGIPEAAPLLQQESPEFRKQQWPAAKRVSPAEREHRLQLAMLGLTDCFATPERPLVLFLDDLHWLDPASGRAVEAILERGRNPHLLVIATARSPDDSQNDALNRLIRSVVPDHRYALGPLPADAAREILTRAAPTLSNVPEIAAECLRRSRGNALVFVQQLHALHQEGTLRFDQKQERWLCEIDELQRTGPGFAGAEFLAKQIVRLPPATRTLLEAAACIGSEFLAGDLALAKPDFDAARIERELARALQDNIIVRLGAQSPPPKDGPGSGYPIASGALENYGRYRFAHDRIREAAYAGIQDAKRAALHFAIGSALYARGKRRNDRAKSRRGTDPALRDEFEIFEQLRRGRQCINKDRDRAIFLRIGLQATRRARLAGAHETAFASVRDALDMLPQNHWETIYTIARTLYLEAAELAYLNHEHDLADRYFRTLLRHARSDDDRIRALSLKIVAANHVARFDAAIDAGLRALRIAGVRLQFFQTPKLIGALLSMRWRLRGAPITRLARLPFQNETRTRRILELCMHLIPPAFLANRNLAILCGLKMLSIALKFGNSPVAYSAYGMYAAILSLVWKDYRGAYRFGRLSLELCERENNPAFHANALFGAGVFTSYWGEALDASREMFERGLRESLRCSDLVYAAYNARVLIGVWIMGGTPLPVFADGLRRLRELSYKIQDPDLNLLIRIAETRLQALRETGDLSAKTIAEFSDKLNTEPARGYHALFFLESACILNADDVARTQPLTRALAKLDEFLTSGFYFADALLFRGLILARQIKSSFWNRRRLRRIIKQLKKFSLVSPVNFLHRVEWLSAEVARLEDRVTEAAELYDRAAETAQANSFAHHAAAIAECAGRFHFARKKMPQARARLRAACDGFRNWGAEAKARKIAAEFSGWFGEGETIWADSAISNPEHIARLDLETVLGAARSILGEIRLVPLLERLMPEVLRSSGADRVALLFESDGELRLEALASADSLRLLPGLPIARMSERSIAADDEVPLDLLRFVSRSQRVALAGAASADYNFDGDTYFKRRRPAAAMALPLIYQGRSRGVLYLENMITRESFNEKRVALLTVLSGQIASAIENARLYRDTEILGATVGRLLDATRAISRTRTPVEAALTAVDFAREFLNDPLSGHCIYLRQSPRDGWLKIDSRADEDLILSAADFQAEVGGIAQGAASVEFQTEPQATAWIAVRVADQLAAMLRLDLRAAREGSRQREQEALEGMAASLALSLDLLGRKDREKLAIVGELASEIVHDIHNHAHLIERGRELAAAGQPEYFDLIREETQQLFGMSRDILDFAGERMLLNRRDVELENFADEVRRKLALFFKGREIMIELNLHGTGRVALDRERMLRAILNLAKNAGEAMPDGGEFHVAIYTEDELLYIACRDTGTGIRPELQANLFQAFVTHGKSGGSGLGLAVADRVVRAHGGGIQLESEPGQGSCFRLVIPRQAPPEL